MRSLLFLLVFWLLIAEPVFSQSPAGIAANNTLWLRSDIGLTSAANIVSQWQELSGANVTGNFTVQPLTGTLNTQTGPLVVNAGINFNPYLRFDGITNSLSSTNLFTGTSLVTNSNVTVFQVLTVKGGIVWLKWETDQVGATARLGFENSAGNIRFDFPKAVPASAGQNIGVTNVLNKHSLSTAYADAVSSVNRLNGADNNTIPIPGPGDFAAGTDKIVIGNENLINLPAQVDMAEIIIYSRTLTAAERNKVESYLAVKYGFTLDQAAVYANDYTASGGTIIWNRAANSGYAADITGIGRDDASSLSQKQSKSVNTGSLVTIYNGTYPGGNFPLTNAANTNGFASDQAFLLAGDNGGTITLDQCTYNGKGQRMQRVWKVSKTGNVGAVTLSVDQVAVAPSVKNLLVSTNPAFPAAATTIYPLTATGGKLFADISFNHNDYFTFATDTLVVTLNPTQPTCANPNGGSVITTITGSNQPLTYSWTPSGQITPDLTNVPGGPYTLTITQGSCQSTYPVVLTTPVNAAAPLANGVNICTGTTGTLSVINPLPGYTYTWYAAASGGTALGTGVSFTTPVLVSPTTYYVEAASGTCTSPRTAVPVTITTVSAPAANGAIICTGTTGSLSVINPLPGYTYTWYAAASGGTSLGTGVTFTTPVLVSPTTYYVEAAIGTCISPRTAVPVTITTVAAPAANGTTICPGTTATLFIQGPNAAYTYNWYNVAVGGVALATGISFTTPALTTATTYYLEAANGSCVSNRTAVLVNVDNIAAPVSNHVIICPGTTALLSVQNPNTAYTYNWYDIATGGVPLSTGTSFTTLPVLTPTAWYVEASDGNCNSPRTGVPVSFTGPLDTPRVVVTSIALNSLVFSWYPVAGADSYEVSVDGGPLMLPDTGPSGGTYTVTGLSPSQTVTIAVIALGPAQGCGTSAPGHATATTFSDGFYVPSAFTPNGDTQNDILTPTLPGGSTLDYFTIFNRYGEKVFSTNIIGLGWDGKFKGKLQNTGSFVWICRYTVRGSTNFEKGVFILFH